MESGGGEKEEEADPNNNFLMNEKIQMKERITFVVEKKQKKQINKKLKKLFVVFCILQFVVR
jgi:hypothetical protein